MNHRPLTVISGNANKQLAENICTELKTQLSSSKVNRFNDGEINIELSGQVRGCDVFVIQATAPPVNDNFMELCLILDTLKRSNCWKVTAVMPYYGYGRQDKKLKSKVPISAKAIADMIQAVGVDRILTIDLHSNQIQGYFDCPVDNLFASPVFLNHMKNQVMKRKYENISIVSPDAGGIERATFYAKRLDCSVAMFYKRRSAPGAIAQMTLLGDVEGKTAILLDDMIDTAGTICDAANALRDNGAVEVIAYATHGLFSGPALARIDESDFDRIYVTDSILQGEEILTSRKIRVLTCAELLGAAIRNIHNESSVSELFFV